MIITNMYPDLFGIQNFSYILLISLGLIGAFIIIYLYFQKKQETKKFSIDILIISLISVIFGLIFATLFQNLYNFIESPSTFTWTFSMTFIGGLLGGSGIFILLIPIFFKQDKWVVFSSVLTVAPACITFAHSLGRIGCFLAGCCYGLESNAWYSVSVNKYHI